MHTINLVGRRFGKPGFMDATRPIELYKKSINTFKFKRSA